ncbi:MAG: 4-hydroxy-3-methylbut-2-enyl diphosphate reductase [Proteobacteria bacterium]|nr:4-hydroxy-3-methylbut-2-enyl diphosphate reductase [Pseudomonadota bacterium]
MKVVLAQPRGFCAGVERAIAIVERALELYGPPVYVRHEIVHNRHVVEDLRRKGAKFVSEIDEVPDGAITIFSAHGVSQKVEDAARDRNLPVIDATCPLVAKVHKEGQKYEREGREVVLIGHDGHPEVEGTRGRIDGGVHLVSTAEDVANLNVGDPSKLAYVTQTTLSVDDTRDVIQALQRRFPEIVGPDVRDICYATQNRQHAIRQLAAEVDLILVIGSRNSSNSNRLREIGEEENVPTYLIDDASCIDPGWLDGVEAVGITAGASAPEILIQELVERLRALAEVKVEVETLDGVDERVHFKMPAALAQH